MPTFSAAFSNLGGVLGELDRPEAAVAAFAQSLAYDPESFTTWNNIGVVHRERLHGIVVCDNGRRVVAAAAG